MYGIITKKEAMANSEKKMDAYRLTNACERAFDKYEADLIRAGKGSLLNDTAVRWAVFRAFYGAASVRDLKELAAMEPNDIAAIVQTYLHNNPGLRGKTTDSPLRGESVHLKPRGAGEQPPRTHCRKIKITE